MLYIYTNKGPVGERKRRYIAHKSLGFCNFCHIKRRRHGTGPAGGRSLGSGEVQNLKSVFIWHIYIQQRSEETSVRYCSACYMSEISYKTFTGCHLQRNSLAFWETESCNNQRQSKFTIKTKRGTLNIKKSLSQQISDMDPPLLMVISLFNY